MEKKTAREPLIDEMFKVGAQYAYSKSRRHPTSKGYIFGVKNRVEIFDLEKTSEALGKALGFVKELASEKKTILFVGGKNEAKEAIKEAASALKMPYVAGRWIGGTLTNFVEIQKRISKYEDLTEKKEKGELSKFTKKERLLIDRDIEDLETKFGGIISMKKLPQALFVVDSKQEKIAVEEAKMSGIPVIALSNSDCDLGEVNYPIPGNDSNLSSIKFFVEEVRKAYEEGLKTAKKEVND
jgi:small subunit ribosomal protein S2